MRAPCVLLLLLLCVVALAHTADARPLTFSPDRELTLTHEPSYRAPAPPADFAAYAAHALKEQQHARLSASPSDPPQLPHCGECQVAMQIAEWVAESNSNLSLLEALLDDVCVKYMNSSAPLCEALVHKLIEFGAKVPATLKHIGLYEPIRLCSFMGFCSVSCCTDDVTPQQIALAPGADATIRHVSWVTGGNNTDSVVAFGFNGYLNQQASGYQLTYTEGGWLGTIHRVVLSGLKPNTVYMYRVGGANSNAPVYNFTTWDASALATPFTLAVVGDMAAGESDYSDKNRAWLNQAAQQGDIDAVIHVGDISYADGYMATWDLFFTELQPTMTHVPYAVVPGNHELLFNFTSYDSRFFMPGLDVSSPLASGTNLYSSWDVACVHFIGLWSENTENTAAMTDAQLKWLQADLEHVQARRSSQGKEGARRHGAQGSRLRASGGECSIASQSFIVVYLHRPVYCTDVDSANCGTEAAFLQAKLEGLFRTHGVDLVISGHIHNIERTQPMYQGQVDLEQGVTYVVNGAGGNREGVVSNFATPAPAWSAFRAGAAGVGQIVIHNATTLEWNFYQQYNSSQAPTMVDQVFLQARTRTNTLIERDNSLLQEQ